MDNAGVLTVDFSASVQNVHFRVAGLATTGGAEVRAYDAFGSLVAITTRPGGNISAPDNDAAAGDETFSATTF